MIYDAKGRPLYRKIGFDGGLVVKSEKHTLDCVAGESIQVDQSEPLVSRCLSVPVAKGENGKP